MNRFTYQQSLFGLAVALGLSLDLVVLVSLVSVGTDLDFPGSQGLTAATLRGTSVSGRLIN